MSLGALGVITSFGVLPEAVAGHSYGELSALCGAGRLESDSLHLLSNVRGRLMAKKNGGADRGAMLAVQASEAKVNQFLGADTSQLVIANRNSPSQFVLAGSTSGIGAAAESLRGSRFARVCCRWRRRFTADWWPTRGRRLRPRLRASNLRAGIFRFTRTPLLRPTRLVPRKPATCSPGQIVNPVDFMAQDREDVRRWSHHLYRSGSRSRLEEAISVQAILQGRVVWETIAMDSSRGTRSGTFDLAIALCRVAALGHPVDLKRWEIAPEVVKTGAKAGFTVPISGANVRSSKPRRPAVLPNAESASKTGRASVLASPNISARIASKVESPAASARSEAFEITEGDNRALREDFPSPQPVTNHGDHGLHRSEPIQAGNTWADDYFAISVDSSKSPPRCRLRSRGCFRCKNCRSRRRSYIVNFLRIRMRRGARLKT